MDLIIITKEN